MEVNCLISGNYTLITGTSNKIKKLVENQVDRGYFDSRTSLNRLNVQKHAIQTIQKSTFVGRTVCSNEYQLADRVAKWIALCATVPRGPTSPYASLDALFRASKTHVRVYGVISRIVSGKLVAFHNTGFNGPFWASPSGCRAKRNWFPRPSPANTQRRSEWISTIKSTNE